MKVAEKNLSRREKVTGNGCGKNFVVKNVAIILIESRSMKSGVGEDNNG